MNIDALKTSRTPIRRAVSNLIKIFETEIEKGTDMSTEVIEETLAKLVDKEATLDKMDHDIQELCKIENLEKEIEEREKYKDQIITWKVRANRILNKILASSHSENSVPINMSKNDNNQYMKTVQCAVKLPRLEISKYDGNILKFEEFWEQFKTAIHENETLNKIQKFTYLKSYLINEAARSIQGLTLTSENYDIGIDILQQRFGRKEIIIDAHVNKLLNLSPVRKSYDTHSLRKLYSECEINIRGLKNLGVEINSYNCLLYPILMKLIPKDLTLEFSKQTYHKKENSVSELLEFLKKEIECRERNEYLSNEHNYEIQAKKFITPIQNKSTLKPEQNKKNSPSKINMPMTSAFNTQVLEEKCIFCGLDHRKENCKLTIKEKRNALMKNGYCFSCLKKAHIQSNCNRKKLCKGKKTHHPLLCNCKEIKSFDTKTTNNNSISPTSSETATPLPDENEMSNVYCASACNNSVYLQTLKAEIINENKVGNIRILCDLGANRSFCSKKCAIEMNLKTIAKEQIKVFSFGKTSEKYESKDRVNIKLRNPFDHTQVFFMEAIVSDIITNAKIPPPCEQIKLLCERKGIRLADEINSDNDDEISLLIGSDFLWKFYTGKVQRLSENFVAVETLFGYCLSGTQNLYSKEALYLNVITEQIPKSDDVLTNQITKFWDLECLGIKDNIEDPENSIDILEEFENSTKFENRRYQVALPWNEHYHKLKDNYEIAETRFRSLIKRFEKNTEFFERYKSVINKHLLENIAEPVKLENESKNEKKCYVPHQAVLKEDRDTTKLRVVFDCSSHAANSLSLNDCLKSGPNLNPEILALLLQFREKPIAFTADIEQAFLQIFIRPEDRDSVRFLWLDEELYNKRDLKYKILRMTRVLFGTTASTFLLAATLKLHFKKFEAQFARTCDLLNSQVYVDDFISGSDDEVQSLEIYKEVKYILSEGGFNMRKWRTNNQELQNKFNDAEQIVETIGSKTKVLGYIWNSEEDKLEINIDNKFKFNDDHKTTKRELVSFASRIFDPCGFISPFTIRPKILLQDIWKLKIKWDEFINPVIEKEWRKWCNEMKEPTVISIPRFYFSESNQMNNMQLHCFVDASVKCYGAVLYLRYTDSINKVSVLLLCSKNRVTPLKKITLPRLELMSAVVGTRLTEYVKTHVTSLRSCNVHYWTDSMIVLHWIRGKSKKLKTFVSNRISEIKRKTDATSWFHCPGKENPADFLTRGMTLDNIQKNDIWWHGPRWLKEDEMEWPNNELDDKILDVEIENTDEVSLTIFQEIQEPLFDIRRFSKLSKLLRITAWIRRFLRNVKNPHEKLTGPIITEEIEMAEKYWIRNVQEQHFFEEIKSLRGNKPLQKNSKILQMNPFQDSEGIIRVGGRLQKSELSYSEIHPIILPGKCYFSNLQIMDCHVRVGHAGVGETLTQVRERFWILKGRQMVKKIISRCLVCKRWNTKPCTEVIAPLPTDRITEALPFEVSGIDFFGPLFTKDQNKTYVALFTCAVIRAVHLELVPDLTASSFLLAFRRFVSRRGICKVIYSDNAKTFKRAEKEIQKIWSFMNTKELQEFFSDRRIQWKYIVERAAFWGGFWERLVRTTKNCLKKVLGKSFLSYQELETTLTEVEAIINSRPLTYIYNEVNEPEPLCPGHFLIGKRPAALPSGKIINESRNMDITRRFKYRLRLLDQFWKKWKTQYIMELKSAHESRDFNLSNEIKKDMVVLLHEDNQPRSLWKMGIVTDVHPGRDGKIRACTLRIANGNHLRRAVQHLYPLELNPSQELLPSGPGVC